MLLLYLKPVQIQIQVVIIYIPLCFYFIVVAAVSFRPVIFIYIPLCFYFIEYHPADLLFHLSDLHSTMLLLYQSLLYSSLFSFTSFTFHYASTLSYCPSCQGGRNQQFTFHYASTLSQIIPQCLNLLFIYIPLCFYFIEFGRPIKQLHILIYIPLCFYFILEDYYMPEYANNLHSTMLLLYQSLLYSSLFSFSSFTFHYASTLSTLLPVITNIVTDLHSTMLLLYPSKEKSG